jgi:hypothetical protein
MAALVLAELVDAPRRVSEVCERYVTQRGSVGTQTGLGFNICVASTLTFCPCISEEETDEVWVKGVRVRDASV